jgi:fibro-slime domain-containing protein
MPDLPRTTPLLALVLLAAPASGQQEMELRGILRDFHASHDDFDVTASAGFGHYAGTVDLTLGAGFSPGLTSGFYVMSQWTDTDGRNIAPHLMMNNADLNGPLFLVNGEITVTQGTLDSLNDYGTTIVVTNSTATGAVTLINHANIIGDVYVGAGGSPSNVCSIDGSSSVTGVTQALGSPILMPVVDEPASMPPSAGNYVFTTETVSTDRHYNDVLIKKNHTVTINGDVRILVDGNFAMGSLARLDIGPDSTLELCVKGDVTMAQNSAINENTQDPNLLMFKIIGSRNIHFSNRNRVYGTLRASQAHLTMENHSLLGGSIAVETLTVNNNAVGSGDGSGSVTTLGCGLFDDDPGEQGVTSTGGISTPGSFGEWFADLLGVNLSAFHTITFLNDGAGVWEYLDDGFYPADNRLFGNDGDAHNHYFTYEVRAWGTFESCAGQFIEFEGGDGVWLYINGTLVLDLGGVQANALQLIELDRLGLADGATIDVHLFYANRNAAGSVFRMRTNIDLTTAYSDATASAVFD